MPSGFDELKDKCGFWINFTLLGITPPLLSHLIFHAIFVKPQKFPNFEDKAYEELSILPSSIPGGSFGHKLTQSP